MQLVEIDVIRAEPLQRALDGVENILAVQPRHRAARAQPVHRAAAGDFGRDDEIVAAAALFEPGADDGFGRAIGLGAGRDGIKLGGVEEIDSLRDGVIHLRKGVVGAGLLAKGHGAEADFGNGEIGAAEGAKFHGRESPDSPRA